jgi:hypothetical protein
MTQPIYTAPVTDRLAVAASLHAVAEYIATRFDVPLPKDVTMHAYNVPREQVEEIAFLAKVAVHAAEGEDGSVHLWAGIPIPVPGVRVVMNLHARPTAPVPLRSFNDENTRTIRLHP